MEGPDIVKLSVVGNDYLGVDSLTVVIVAIIGLLGAAGYPKYANWRRDRAVKLQSEKIVSLLTSATTQVERGYYAYVKVEFEKDTAPSQITVKGINQVDFSK